MLHDEDPVSKKWNEDLQENKKNKRDPIKKETAKAIIIFCILLKIFLRTWVEYDRYFTTKNSSSILNYTVEEQNIETIPYECNQPIEIFDDNGENTGTITAKSARMVMGKEAMVEVTYEITKKIKDFREEIKLYTFDGTFLTSFIGDSKYVLDESSVDIELVNLLGIKNDNVDWNQELEGTTLSVIKYYKYKPLKENFIVGICSYDNGKMQMASINLNPLIENKTLDLSVADQQPVTEQANVVVPLGEEKRVSMIDVRVNRSKIGKGSELLVDNNCLDKDKNYIILDVDIKNNSAVTLTEDDIFNDFSVTKNDTYSEKKYFTWNDKLEVANETLIIKPGESKKVAFVFATYEKVSKKGKKIYVTYNPDFTGDDKLTKFNIME